MEKSTDISDCLKIDDKIEEVDGKNIFDFLFKTGTLKDSEGSDIEKNKKIKSELEIEEEKYLENIFEEKKNEFNSIFSTINGTNIDESPEEKLKKYIWLNFNMENFYLDDNVGIEKNIAVELFLTDEEIKNGTIKIVKYEKTEFISKYNYINETEEIESQTVEYEKKIVILQNIEEGTVYKFIDCGNCFEDIDEKIQQGDLYVFILRGVENEYM